MAWVAVDKDGSEWVYEDNPDRKGDYWFTPCDAYVQLPQGTIKKLIGRELTWNDEPVELK